MKILLVHKFFHLTGGAEVFFFETGRVLELNGHTVEYFSTKSPKNVKAKFDSFFCDPPDYLNPSLLKRLLSIKNIIYSNSSKTKFEKVIKLYKPDIIHVFSIQTHITPSILDVCRQMKIPVVMSCNDYKHICPNYKLFHHGRLCEECKGEKFYNAVKNRCCKDSILFSVASCFESYIHASMNIYKKNISTFLFSSQFMANKTKDFWATDTFRWRILRNPFSVDTNIINGTSDNYFIYFGRIIDEKGVDILIKAASLIPNTIITIIGDGPDRSSLELFAKLNGLLNVQFVGSKWGAELNDYLRNCRGVIVPSLWHENFPYVILQAFAAGKPVIGSNRGGIPELLCNGRYGLTYEASDVQGLATCIRKLSTDKQMAIQMGNAAREYVKYQFNDEIFYNQLMNIYQEVLI